MTARVADSRLLTAVVLGFLALGAEAPVAATADSLTAPPTTLTNAGQIVALGVDFPAGRYVAKLQGVVIYISAHSPRFYMQAGDHGVQVNLPGSVVSFRVGQQVEVVGEVQGGLPEIRLVDARASLLGDAPLPIPKPISPHNLAAGAEPFRFVSIRAAVRDMMCNGTNLWLLLAHEGLTFEALIPADISPLPRAWLDAEVELRGHSWPIFNSDRRATGFRFHLADTNYLKVLSPGIADRFARPLLSCAEAARLPQQWVPRVRIAGTVTVHRPGAAFFVDDGTGVMHVDLLRHMQVPTGASHLGHEPQTWLQPGERVEVIGVRHNSYSLTPTLTQAEYRRIGQAPPVKPLEVSVSDLMEGRHPGRLITLKARLLDKRQWRDVRLSYQSLVLLAGDDVFQARWESETPATWDLKLDDYVRITGVNDAEGSASRKRSTFQIVLRSPADVVPVEAPPFWARAEVWRLLLAASGVGLVAAAWILFQRLQMRRLERRVAERTTDLSSANARLTEEVTARERAEEDLRVSLHAEKELSQLKSNFVSMVSHEFRTPLEVILSSSNILDRYLDRLAPDQRKAQLRAIRASVHRMSDLMEDVLLLGRFEAGRLDCHPMPLDLEAYCRQLYADTEAAATSGRIKFAVDQLDEKATADGTLLQHILSNLLSNALKYSPDNSPVDFAVSRQGQDAVFVIRDSGRGIPKADQPHLFSAFHRGSNVGQTPGSGLGLVIVKRCIESHGGTLDFKSTEGLGTTFTVTLPLFGGTSLFRKRPPDARAAQALQ